MWHPWFSTFKTQVMTQQQLHGGGLFIFELCSTLFVWGRVKDALKINSDSTWLLPFLYCCLKRSLFSAGRKINYSTRAQFNVSRWYVQRWAYGRALPATEQVFDAWAMKLQLKWSASGTKSSFEFFTAKISFQSNVSSLKYTFHYLFPLWVGVFFCDVFLKRVQWVTKTPPLLWCL